uniref:Uncharacterized protein n=1 Tax=Oncorhynchus mykiss TaxID=8022 RepID=A0A8C7P2T3_ONCMY
MGSIREYHAKDKDAVILLFHNGILEHVYPAFFKAMSRPDQIAPISCHCSLEELRRMTTNMAGIQASYLDNSDNSFWVAESGAESKECGKKHALMSKKITGTK